MRQLPTAIGRTWNAAVFIPPLPGATCADCEDGVTAQAPPASTLAVMTPAKFVAATTDWGSAPGDAKNSVPGVALISWPITDHTGAPTGLATSGPEQAVAAVQTVVRAPINARLREIM